MFPHMIPGERQCFNDKFKDRRVKMRKWNLHASGQLSNLIQASVLS